MLDELILVLSEDDLRAFRAFLKQRNKRGDTKNIDLLNSLLSKDTDDINIVNKLYEGFDNRDAYHALRKRLYDSLLHFMANKTLASASGEVYESLRLLLLGRYLLENELPRIALKCLSIAERKSVNFEQFSLLNEIYLTQIQYAHLFPEQNLELLMRNYLLNQSNIQREAKLNIVYAILRRELKEIHLAGKIVDLNVFIQNIISGYGISLKELLTYKSLSQVLFIVNEYAAIQQDYRVVEVYVKTSLRFIEKQGDKAEQYMFHHLNILYYLANFALRSRLFDESLAYLKEISAIIEKGQSIYKHIFDLRLQLLLGLNAHFQGRQNEALNIVKNALGHTDKRARQEDIDDLQLAYVMMLTQANDKSALKEMARFSHSNAWYEKRLGMLWVIRKSVLEILTQGQFGNIDVSLSLITSFKKRYKKYLEQVNESRVLLFISLIAKYFDNPSVVKEKVFNKKIQILLVEEESRKDLFSMSFLGWLLARGRTESSYEMMLKLL